MFSLASKLIKMILFVVVVVLVANRVRWSGETLSDKIETTAAHAELTYHQSPFGPGNLNRAWSQAMGTLLNQLATTHAWVEKKKASYAQKAKEAESVEKSVEPGQSSERQKLRALIDELNRSSN